MDIDASALFTSAAGGFDPTRLTGSPWSPDSLHGGAPAALMARAIEHFEGGEERFVARFTLELLRPVPFDRLRISTELTRPGKRAQLVEARLYAGDREVARASGLRLLRSAISLPDALPSPAIPSVPGPDSVIPIARPEGNGVFHEGFHTHGVEHRFVRGGFEEPGPAVDWIRLRVPVVDDEPVSALCRVCAAADFGNGVSGLLANTHTYINPDLTVYLHRYPETEWVCLDAASFVQPYGVGLAESLLRDESGPIGRSLQSLIVQPRQ